MKRFDDPMFEAFNETFSNFQPEVPEGAYAGIRNKMKKGGFWAFSFTSLNVYTLSALILAAAAVTWAGTNEGGHAANGNLIESIDRPDATLNKVHHHLVESQRGELTNEDELVFSAENSTTAVNKAITTCTYPCPSNAVVSQASLSPLVPIRHEEIKAYDLAKDASALAEDFDNEQMNEMALKNQEVNSAEEVLKSAQEEGESIKKLTIRTTKTK